MNEIDPITGLPKEISNEINLGEFSNNNIKIYSKEIKNRKIITFIEGIEKDKINLIAKKLKQLLACGGTIKNNIIELQGKHEEKVEKLLKEFGYLS